jgi:adenylylsulfate kinase
MSFTLWFTGLPGSGKTTLSRQVFLKLSEKNLRAELLDGDVIRANFAQKLGFSRRDRDINVRHLGLLSLLLNRNGVISLVAAIAPYAATREQNRQLLESYVEVFCQCPLEVAERRDEKGLYARARAGKIPKFTGISDPYEEPRSPDIVVHTDRESIDESVARIINYLEKHRLIPAERSIRLAD